MDRFKIRIHSSFFQRFAHTWMGVGSPSNIFGTGPVFNSHNEFLNEIPSPRRHNMSPQNPISFLIGKELNEPGDFFNIGFHSGIGTHWEITDFVANLFLLQLFFGEPNKGDFWVSVYNTWYGAVVQVDISSCEVLRDCDPLFFGLVREHGALHYIPYGIDIGEVGLELVVDFDPPQLILTHTKSFESKTFSVGGSSCREQANVSFNDFRLP